MPRIRWKAQLTAQDLAPLVTIASASIVTIQTAIRTQQAFVQYDAGGAQRAITTVNWPPNGPQRYATTMQRHSEMVALAGSTAAAPPPPIWSVNAGGTVVANNGNQITGANYVTDLPHCGYCTVMLWAVGLPLGAPTKGRYNYAVNLEYSLPADVSNNVQLLARMFNGNAGGNAALIRLKSMINPFLQNASGEWVLQIGQVFVSDTAVTGAAPPATLTLDWTEASGHQVDVNVQHFGRNTLLVTLWKIIFKGIYDNVN
ncbi:hypothetical protein [Hoeflea olei]|uniref:Uncharacterized protein n=1 Tax=Hoeflea olei TaxID=1480615 RepID=A0A1C1YY76_9HYPH|nr:hypothetical protein [Hoeflea olei]OCW58458.1 hypothetical protein AWJ14_18335 [Hoeflea olei]